MASTFSGRGLFFSVANKKDFLSELEEDFGLGTSDGGELPFVTIRTKWATSRLKRFIKSEPIPERNSAAVKLSSNPNIVIARMNAGDNDVPNGYDVQGYPTIYLARAGRKDEPIRYELGSSLKGTHSISFSTRLSSSLMGTHSTSFSTRLSSSLKGTHSISFSTRLSSSLKGTHSTSFSTRLSSSLKGTHSTSFSTRLSSSLKGIHSISFSTRLGSSLKGTHSTSFSTRLSSSLKGTHSTSFSTRYAAAALRNT
ncbi:hypothetical protein F7725_024616 [Dissostichus mawsoni]|uniref:Uncharacterized protein n=1 Tax=Dissostichus mawsoni TaxID=36200 RepID=A0A7J5X8W3_DISMA|nr:hypothetical protein F7725_024616 [Dissostichus mawsoni]